MLKTLFLVVFLLFSSCYSTKYERTVRYDEEVIIRCPVNAPGIKEFLQSDNVDIWKVTPADGTADVRIHKGLLQEGGNTVAKKECKTIANVESLVQQFENITTTNSNLKQEWFEDYHRYDEIYEWYEQLASENNEVCRFIPSIGDSLEGRRQPAVYIGFEDAKYKIYFQCQIHAREWISGATCMYIADFLVTNAPELRELLQNVEFIFVPFVNPDGYEYTWTNDRLWRKNRAENSGSTCRGVDLNRNYNDHWNEGGSSPNPCSETYHGSSAASEPETQNTQNYFKANAPTIIGAIDWHSYSQLILRPYGWTSADSPDETRLRDLGLLMREAILASDGKAYTSQKSIGLYPTSGTASDWFYGEDATEANGGCRAAGYTMELRDTGQYGFLLPPDQIIPTGKENVEGVLVFAQSLADEPLPNCSQK